MEVKYYTRINKYGYESEYAEFDNIEFYKARGYYLNKKYGRMHRYIYEYYHGKIYDGYHIHHKDFDKSNNTIDNLTMLTHAEHKALHNKGNKNMLGKKHSDKTKELMSKAKKENGSAKGKNNSQYKQRTPEMYEDVKNGMSYKEFKRKYNCSDGYFYRTKKEIYAREFFYYALERYK